MKVVYLSVGHVLCTWYQVLAQKIYVTSLGLSTLVAMVCSHASDLQRSDFLGQSFNPPLHRSTNRVNFD